MGIFILAPAAAACSSPAPFLWEEGDPCRSGAPMCTGEAQLQACIEGTWEIVDCTTHCADQGLVAAEEACAAGRYLDYCWCMPPDGPQCDPLSSQCMGDAVATCTTNSTWELEDCTEVCASYPVAQDSLGCEVLDKTPVCRCSAEGAPCEPEGESRCASATALAVCEGGAWSISPCACGPEESGQCVPDGSGGPACACP